MGHGEWNERAGLSPCAAPAPAPASAPAGAAKRFPDLPMECELSGPAANVHPGSALLVRRWPSRGAAASRRQLVCRRRIQWGRLVGCLVGRCQPCWALSRAYCWQQVAECRQPDSRRACAGSDRRARPAGHPPGPSGARNWSGCRLAGRRLVGVGGSFSGYVYNITCCGGTASAELLPDAVLALPNLFG
jgi:hypothetical protein